MKFFGRNQELTLLDKLNQRKGAQLLILYGRRRIGKTELLEQTFRNCTLLKFEGIEKATPDEQMQFVMRQLAEYTEQKLFAKTQVDDWIDVLKHIAEQTKDGTSSQAV